MSVTLKNDLVSVAIPAYNQPTYTRRLLGSILEQEYHPIEVVLSDDCSPNSLQPLKDEFSRHEDHRFTIKFFRQDANLGPMGNFLFTVDHASGKYIVPFAHDNWFTDTRFIAEAVEIMRSYPTCHVCIANATYENSGELMLKLPAELQTDTQWILLGGDQFTRLWCGIYGGFGWTQAIIVDNYVARKMGAFHKPYVVDDITAQKYGLKADNVFAFLWLLASQGDVALNGRTVCTVGTPQTSYSRTEEWKRVSPLVKFIILYNIHRSKLGGVYSEEMKRQALRQAYYFICTRKVNSEDIRKVIRYFHGDLMVTAIMYIALLRRLMTRSYSTNRLLKLFEKYIYPGPDNPQFKDLILIDTNRAKV